MKPVQMFVMESCPYCQQARLWMREIQRENPAYAAIHIDIVDENRQPDLANQYDYYYVPTYYVNGVKVHEGAATKERVREVFEKACH